MLSKLTPPTGSLIAMVVLGLGGQARGAVSPATTTPVAAAVSKCRKITDDHERLVCYDAAAGAFDRAQSEGQVVVIDRAQANAVRRQAFGFSLPSINFFPSGPKADVEDRVTVELASAHTDADGKWVLTTTEDAVWRQSDSNALAENPHSGSKMLIRKGVLGSFFCKVDGQFAIRCVRNR